MSTPVVGILSAYTDTVATLFGPQVLGDAIVVLAKTLAFRPPHL